MITDEQVEAGAQPTYAEQWAEAINETYTNADEVVRGFVDFLDCEDMDAVIRQVLTKAAECLRNGVPTTFTGCELDLVRHLMPAHEVHQSGAKRWVLDVYGEEDQ